MPFFGDRSKIQLNADAQIFNVEPGELTRWYVINAGPRGNVAFNFAGGLINEKRGNFVSNSSEIDSPSQSKVYEISIPPGDGSVIEVIFAEEGPYFGNNRDLGRLLSGAGFVVLATRNSTHDTNSNVSYAVP